MTQATGADLVVIGLGYVGLPLAQGASRAGLCTIGFDVGSAVVDGLNAGKSHVGDISDADVQEMLASGFCATNDPRALAGAKAIVICVPTPLSADGGPDLEFVVKATESIAAVLRPGTLVVLESTTWPGTTEEIVRPILEHSGLVAGEDFALAFSPERIDPGNPTFGLRNTPKLVGGLTPSCTERAVEFYSRLVDTVVAMRGCKEAEMSKLLENTYRHINIALVNEMAKFSHELDIDFWDVVRGASTKPFGFQAFHPGPGVGGHCIPIDPNYLSHRVQAQLGYPFRFVELAQEINSSMPHYVARRVQDQLNDCGLALKGSRVLILGVTYKANIADERESPARPLGMRLLSQGAEVEYYDHFVETWNLGEWSLQRVESLEKALATADIVVHLQPHDSYDNAAIVRGGSRVLDTSGSLEGPNILWL